MSRSIEDAKAMQAVAEVRAWVESAKPGDRRVYHEGLLCLLREHDPALNEVARFLHAQAGARVVHLVQEPIRRPDDLGRGARYRYIVEKASGAAQETLWAITNGSAARAVA